MSMSSYGFPSLAVPRLKDISSREPYNIMAEYIGPDNSTKYSSKFLQTDQEMRNLKTSLDTRTSMLWDSLQSAGGGTSSFTNSVPKSSFTVPGNHDTLKTTTMSRPLVFPLPMSNESLARPDYEIGAPVKFKSEAKDISFRESPRKPMPWPGIDSNFKHKAMSAKTTDNEMPWAKTQTLLTQQEETDVDLRDFISSHMNKLSQEQGPPYNMQEPPVSKQTFETPRYYINNVAGGSTNMNNNDYRYIRRVPTSSMTKGPINPSSDSYLKRLDAHLESMVGKVLRADNNQWPQNNSRPGRKADPDSKWARLHSGRSSSLEEPKIHKSTMNRSICKSRSASVPRPKTRKWLDSRPSSENMTRDKDLSEITFDDLLTLANDLKKHKAKAKGQKPVSNRRKTPTVLNHNKCQSTTENTQGERNNSMTDIKGSLDKKQQKTLMGLLADMTRDEGDILMRTVASILKSRLAKRCVAFRDEMEPQMMEKGENVNKDSRDNDFNDEPFACAESISSLETHFLTASNSDKSLEYNDSVSSNYSPEVRKHERTYNVWCLTDEQDIGSRRSSSRLRRCKTKIRSSTPEILKARQRPNSETRQQRLKCDGKKAISCTEARLRKSPCFRKTCSINHKDATPSFDKHAVKNKTNQYVYDRCICGAAEDQITLTLRPYCRGKKGNAFILDNSDHRASRIRRRSRPTTGSSVMAQDRSLLKIGNEKGMANHITISTQTESHHIRTPTPSPPMKELSMPAKHCTEVLEEPIHSDNLNASCSTTSPTYVLKNQNSKIDLDALSFDEEACLTETSLSQKIADLNLSVEHHEENVGMSDPDKREQVASGSETLKCTTEHHAPDFTETYFSINNILESDNSVLLHINRNTKNLLEKANEKMKRVELILDSISNDPYVILPMTSNEPDLEYSTKDWTFRNTPRLEPPLKEINDSDISPNILKHQPLTTCISSNVQQHQPLITCISSNIQQNPPLMTCVTSPKPALSHPRIEKSSGNPMPAEHAMEETKVNASTSTPKFSMAQNYPSLRGTSVPKSVSVSKESAVGPLNSITQFSIQSTSIISHSTVLDTSSTSLVSSTTDSPLSTSFDSDLAAIKFDKACIHGQHYRLHSLADVEMAKRVLQSNHHNYKNGVRTQRKQEPVEIPMVKGGDTAKPMLGKNRKNSLHEPIRKSIQFSNTNPRPVSAISIKVIKETNQMPTKTLLFDANVRQADARRKTVADSSPKAIDTTFTDTSESAPSGIKSIRGSSTETNQYSFAKPCPQDSKTESFLEWNRQTMHTSSPDIHNPDTAKRPLSEPNLKTSAVGIRPLDTNKKPLGDLNAKTTETPGTDSRILHTNKGPINKTKKPVQISTTNIRTLNANTRRLNESNTKTTHTSTTNTRNLDTEARPLNGFNLKTTQTSSENIRSLDSKSKIITESNQQSTQTSFSEDNPSAVNRSRRTKTCFEPNPNSTYYSQFDMRSPERSARLSLRSKSETFSKHQPNYPQQCLRPVQSPVATQTTPTAQSEDLTQPSNAESAQQIVNRKFLQSLHAHKNKVEKSKLKHSLSEGHTMSSSGKPWSKNVLQPAKSSRISLAKKKVATKLPPFRV